MSLRPDAGRRRGYKVIIDREQARFKREDQLVAIRKTKREQTLLKRRREEGTTPDRQQQRLKNLQRLTALVSGAWSTDPTVQLRTTIEFRELLSSGPDPPIQEVLDSGVVPRLIQFLKRKEFIKLQFEAAWTLSNIASGSSKQTRFLMDRGAASHLVDLLISPDDEIREQAVWALGNMAADSSNCQELIICHGALEPLLRQVNENSRPSMLRIVSWTLLNFCHGIPLWKTSLVLPVLVSFIQSSSDEEVLANACWALSYLLDGPSEGIEAVIQVGIASRLTLLLRHPSPSVVLAALRTLGKILKCKDMHDKLLIAKQALPCIPPLLARHQKKNILVEACWVISNVTTGNQYHIQAVIDANTVEPLLSLLADAEFDVKREAVWAIGMAIAKGTHEQIVYMVNQGCIQLLCDLLGSSDSELISICLKALNAILLVGEAEKNTRGFNVCAQEVEEVQGRDKIEALLGHENWDIENQAAKMLNAFWIEEEELEEEEIKDDSNAQGFSFNVSTDPVHGHPWAFAYQLQQHTPIFGGYGLD